MRTNSILWIVLWICAISCLFTCTATERRGMNGNSDGDVDIDGSDGDSPTLRLSIDSAGAVDVVGDFTAGTVRSDDGVSGTLELDDGTTEKITLVFTGGILTSRTVAATTGSVLADWTD